MFESKIIVQKPVAEEEYANFRKNLKNTSKFRPQKGDMKPYTEGPKNIKNQSTNLVTWRPCTLGFCTPVLNQQL